MEKTKREKVALVVFILLIVFAGAALTSYFSTGRSWTQAATFVDDTVGAMEGYDVVVFAGTLQPEDIFEESDDDHSMSSSSAQSTSIVDLEDDTSVTADDTIDVQGLVDPEQSMGLRILALYPKLIHEEYDGVFVSDVRDLYERKDAEAITLNISDLAQYEEPFVIETDNKKIGIFSATKYMNRSALEKVRSALEDDGAEVIICLTPRVKMLSNLDCADVVIVTEPIFNKEETYRNAQGTLVVEAPEVGDVGVIVLSANNVATSRTIRAL